MEKRIIDLSYGEKAILPDGVTQNRSKVRVRVLAPRCITVDRAEIHEARNKVNLTGGGGE